jgi:hypothetical protein
MFRYTLLTRAEDKALQGWNLSADASADWRDGHSRPAPVPVCPKALNPGVAGAKPPSTTKHLTKGGESPPEIRGRERSPPRAVADGSGQEFDPSPSPERLQMVSDGVRWCQMAADGRPLVAEPLPWPTVPYRQRAAFALTYLLSLPSRVAWLFRRRERDEE